MDTRQATAADLEAWVRLRHALWPDHPVADLGREAREILSARDQVCFLALDGAGTPVGFIEAALHSEAGRPHCHVEGWFVEPAARGRGYGSELMGRVEQWSLHMAISILTSDTTPGYPLSSPAHERCGFRRIHEMTIFLKDLEERQG